MPKFTFVFRFSAKNITNVKLLYCCLCIRIEIESHCVNPKPCLKSSFLTPFSSSLYLCAALNNNSWISSFRILFSFCLHFLFAYIAFVGRWWCFSLFISLLAFSNVSSFFQFSLLLFISFRLSDSIWVRIMDYLLCDTIQTAGYREYLHVVATVLIVLKAIYIKPCTHHFRLLLLAKHKIWIRRTATLSTFITNGSVVWRKISALNNSFKFPFFYFLLRVFSLVSNSKCWRCIARSWLIKF